MSAPSAAMNLELEEEGAFLGVIQSASGKKWVRNAVDMRAAYAMAQTLDIPQLTAELLVARGQTIDSAPSYLSPKLRDLMPDPLRLQDMQKAADRFADAIIAGEQIAVFGDYDVDGGTSSALLARFARALGHKLRLYVPDRMAEGYGPNAAALQKLRDEGATLTIAVDCGTTAYAPLQHAADIGLDIIVLDHHTAEPQLPPAVAVVNPNRLDDMLQPQLGICAAVGVVFLFIVAATRVLRARGFFTDQRPEPDLMQWLDLVALGTVADVVPLSGLNRAFVAQGLKVMQKRLNPGLVALADSAKLVKAPDAFALGFVYGPRVNAGGRVGESTLGARLLSSDHKAEVREIAQLLEGYNAARKMLEVDIQQEANDQLDGYTGHMAMAVGEGWHAGVIGIVAARLKERFHRPSFVIAVDEKGIGKGSGRSIRGVDLGALTIAARQQGLLIAGGGHAMAAGLTVARENIPALRAFFEERLDTILTEEILQPKLVVDGLIGLGSATVEFLDKLDCFAPYGSGNPEPRFALSNVRIVSADIVGTDHVRCVMMDGENRRMKGIAFRCMETPMGPLLLSKPQNLKIVGRLSRDDWNGRNDVQFQIEDVAVG